MKIYQKIVTFLCIFLIISSFGYANEFSFNNVSYSSFFANYKVQSLVDWELAETKRLSEIKQTWFLRFTTKNERFLPIELYMINGRDDEYFSLMSYASFDNSEKSNLLFEKAMQSEKAFYQNDKKLFLDTTIAEKNGLKFILLTNGKNYIDFLYIEIITYKNGYKYIIRTQGNSFGEVESLVEQIKAMETIALSVTPWQ